MDIQNDQNRNGIIMMKSAINQTLKSLSGLRGGSWLVALVGACSLSVSPAGAAAADLAHGATIAAHALLAQNQSPQTPKEKVDEAERERARRMAKENAAAILKSIREQGGKPDQWHVDEATDEEGVAVINAAPEEAPPAAPIPADAVKGPHIVFDEPTHDFGLVMDKVELKCVFNFRNAGTQTLIVEKVNTGCGCTVAQMPKQQFAPGETGSIEIAYNPKGTGSQNRAMQVLTNDALQRVTTINLKAHVLPVVDARPQTIQFGQVVCGQERKAELVIVSRDPNLVIESVTTNGAEIMAKEIPGRQPVQLVEPELPGRKVIEVTLSDDAPPGRLLKMITIKTRAAKTEGAAQEAHELRVNVFASIKGELSVQPPFIRVRPLAINEQFEREAVLMREGGQSFQIEKIEVVNSTLEGVTAVAEPYEAGENKGYKIIIKGGASDKAKNFRGSVVVHTDMPKEPTVEIQFSGLVRPPIMPGAGAN